MASEIDFSRATKLKGVAFQLEDLGDILTVMALKTLTSGHRDLQDISICLPDEDSVNDGQRAGEIQSWWMDIDRFLVRLWELNAFRAWVIYRTGVEQEARELVEMLLPEMMKKGAVELVDYDDL